MKSGRRIVIDGWHRVRKAAKEGRENLPAVVLTFEETERVRTYEG
jgi:ParB-like chromosome segregation protein Spo0J